MCCSPLVSRVTFSHQVEVGFKSRAFEPHPRFSRYDDSLFMLAILTVHTSSCWTAKRPLKKNEYLRGILGHRRQAGWGFDSFACKTSTMGCAEFPVGQVPSFIFQFQIARSIPSTAIAMRRGPFAGLPSLLLQGSRRAPQCRNKTSVPARACRLSGGKAPRLLLRSGLLPDSRLFASKARQLRHRRRRLRADPSSVVPQWVAKESTCRSNGVLRE